MGFDAIKVNELRMAKSKDKDIFDYAKKNSMIILTADLDFGTILAFTRSNRPSENFQMDNRNRKSDFFITDSILVTSEGLRSL